MRKKVIKQDSLFCGFAFVNLRNRRKRLRFYEGDKLLVDYLVQPNEALMDLTKRFGCIEFGSVFRVKSLHVLAGTKCELTIYKADLKDTKEEWNTFRF